MEMTLKQLNLSNPQPVKEPNNAAALFQAMSGGSGSRNIEAVAKILFPQSFGGGHVENNS